jgi:hypothetical protein
MKHRSMSNMETLKAGLVGAAASFGSVSVSLASDIEPWLRVISLGLGIIIALLTIGKLAKK